MTPNGQVLRLWNESNFVSGLCDDEGMEAFVRIHQDDLFRYIRYLGAGREVAEDIAQEAFLVAFEGRNRPALTETARVGAWLRGVARNKFYTHCRKEKANPVIVNQESLLLAEQQWASDFSLPGDWDGQLEALGICLKKVAGRNRTVLEKRYVEQLSRQGIAAALGIAEEAIKTILRRTKAALRECLEREQKRRG